MCARPPPPPRPHAFIGEPDGSYWLLCDEKRSMDLTGVSGVANASVTGTVVQHVSASGDVLSVGGSRGHMKGSDH